WSLWHVCEAGTSKARALATAILATPAALEWSLRYRRIIAFVSSAGLLPGPGLIAGVFVPNISIDRITCQPAKEVADCRACIVGEQALELLVAIVGKGVPPVVPFLGTQELVHRFAVSGVCSTHLLQEDTLCLFTRVNLHLPE